VEVSSTDVEEGQFPMMRPLRRRTIDRLHVSFCDSCARVCAAECRAETHRDRARTSVLFATLGR